MYSTPYYNYNYDYDSINSTAAAMAGGFIASMMVFVFIFAIVMLVLQIITMWKIFSKAGESGWKALIPIYNIVILFKISGVSPWLILLYLVSWVPFIGWIIPLALTIYLDCKLAKAFGKGSGFTVGLILLPSIFYLILGLGDSKYLGPQE